MVMSHRHAAPHVELYETDQALVDAVARLQLSYTFMRMRFNTAAAGDFSTFADVFRVSKTSAVFSVPITATTINATTVEATSVITTELTLLYSTTIERVHLCWL